MAIMPARTYAAFKEAGVPEDDAIAATESLAAYENRFTNLENCLGSKEARLSNVENRLDHLDSRLVQSRPMSLHWPAKSRFLSGDRDQRRGNNRDPGRFVQGSLTAVVMPRSLGRSR